MGRNQTDANEWSDWILALPVITGLLLVMAFVFVSPRLVPLGLAVFGFFSVASAHLYWERERSRARMSRENAYRGEKPHDLQDDELQELLDELDEKERGSCDCCCPMRHLHD
jgi:hypothetical protein